MELTPPKEFPFPFTPYKIQEEFMKELYTALDTKKCGIFESPTGTGKSMSIICGAIKWLKDHNSMKMQHLQGNINNLQLQLKELHIDKVDWLTTQGKELELTRQLNTLKIESTKMSEYYQKLEDLKGKRKKILQMKKYASKENKSQKEPKVDYETNGDIKDEDLLLEELDNAIKAAEEDDVLHEDKYCPTKIYICSRTHSQLQQLVHEIRKSPFAADIRVVSLASRQNYCINADILRYKNSALINEKCLDMQKQKSKVTKADAEGKSVKRSRRCETSGKCKFFKQSAIEELSESIVLDVQDIEELMSNGRELGACPYYASRRAVVDAEIVLVPYNTILHTATRDANGIDLRDNVVIVDEAHNLLDALGQMYGVTVTREQLHVAGDQLKGYKNRYGKRFSAMNFLRVKQLSTVVAALKAVFENENTTTNDTQIFTIQNFISSAEIDNFNMYHLTTFVKDSKLAHKLHGFARMVSTNPELVIKPPKKENEVEGYKSFVASIDQELKVNEKKSCKKAVLSISKSQNVSQSKEESKKPSPMMANPLLAIVSFLEAIQQYNEDGRILLTRSAEEQKLQYLILNPSSQFTEIVRQARAVIVAGGTMKPLNEFRQRLFANAGANADRIMHFTCDHIVPPENILPIVLTNEEYLFNFENRLKMAHHVQAILTNACKHVQGGIVVFYPSYKYEAWVWDQVKAINFGRPVFREPQGSGSVETVMENYHKAIFKSQGRKAMLFSVVGGKLSEGLNFNDDLGRCIIVFGLPYPNINSPDLKEKMAYLDRNEGSGSGKIFYENICIKAVNQCIGRAVRHINDYASVLLVDVRYNRPATKNALPDWIKRSLKCCKSSDAFKLIQEFFERRK